MQNQDLSLNPEVLPGTSIGPIDELWAQFSAPYQHLSPQQLLEMKLVFFSASVLVYNLVTTSIRTDLTLVTMSIVSEAIRLNIETYFASIQAPSATQMN